MTTTWHTIKFEDPKPKLSLKERIKAKITGRDIAQEKLDRIDKCKQDVIWHGLDAAGEAIKRNVERMGLKCDKPLGMNVKIPLHFPFKDGEQDKFWVDAMNQEMDEMVDGAFNDLIDKIRAQGLDPNQGKFKTIAGRCGDSGDVTIYWQPNYF